ncbi:MAG: NAD-dependent epimerase/dehydratase family protein [Alphaproteobacteria bacterium]
MVNVTVVGKNSFMAKAMREDGLGANWQWLSHQDALDHDEWIANTDCLINFSYAPEMRREPYNESLDTDTKLAQKIKDHDIHYMMLSSRLVYGPQSDAKLVETMPPAPQGQYGMNKNIIEQSVVGVLGEEKVTRLRLSNIFGFEPNRASFFGMALTKLKQENQITYDMSPFTKRDFMSIRHFGKALEAIAQKPVGGIFNLGSGIGLETGWIAQWLIEGYGQGGLYIKDMGIRDVFYLDMDKTRKTFDVPPYSHSDLKQDCIRCGLQMKEHRDE